MNVKLDRGDIAARLKTRDTVDIPTKAGDQEIGTLKVKAEKGVVQEVRWESRPIWADFSKVAPDVGKAEVRIDMNIGTILPDNLDLKIAPQRDEEHKKALERRASQLKAKVKNVAYSVDVKSALAIRGAKLTLKVDKAWADKYGTQNVKITRLTATGDAQLLDTMAKGAEKGQAVFEADTPGFSVFSVAAVEPSVTSPKPAATPKQPGLEALAGITAILLVSLALRRRR